MLYTFDFLRFWLFTPPPQIQLSTTKGRFVYGYAKGFGFHVWPELSGTLDKFLYFYV
jgi:hypothetical protein